MKLLIVAGLPHLLPKEDYDKYIGVDAGSYWLLKNHLPMDLAVGDFDSLSTEEFSELSESGPELIRLQAEKNETDLEVALLETTKRYPEAEEIKVYGALGGRLDHELYNLSLPLTEKLQKFSENIIFENEKNRVSYLKAGSHLLPKIPNKKYIAFLQKDTDRTFEIISGAKYPLKPEENFADIYTSNEFLAESDFIEIKFDKGFVIVIYTED